VRVERMAKAVKMARIAGRRRRGRKRMRRRRRGRGRTQLEEK